MSPDLYINITLLFSLYMRKLPFRIPLCITSVYREDHDARTVKSIIILFILLAMLIINRKIYTSHYDNNGIFGLVNIQLL